MTNYVGETLGVAFRITDPITGQPISDGSATADLYAPGRDPAGTPSDRANPDVAGLPLTFDAGSGKWLAQIATAGLAPGIWTYRVTHAGVYAAFEFFTFTLTA